MTDLNATQSYADDVAPAHQELCDPMLSAKESALYQLFRQALFRPFDARAISRTKLMTTLGLLATQEMNFLMDLRRERRIAQPAWLLPSRAEVHQALFAYVDSFLSLEPGGYGVALERLATALVELSRPGEREEDGRLGFSEVATRLGISFAELQRWIELERIPRGVFELTASESATTPPPCYQEDFAHITPAIVEAWRTLDASPDSTAILANAQNFESLRGEGEYLIAALDTLKSETGFHLLDSAGQCVYGIDGAWRAISQAELQFARMIPVRATVFIAPHRLTSDFCVTVRQTRALPRPQSTQGVLTLQAELARLNTAELRRQLDQALDMRLQEAVGQFGKTFPEESVEQLVVELQRELSCVLEPDDVLDASRFFAYTSAPVARLMTARWRATRRQ